jgi:hypothetical protein
MVFRFCKLRFAAGYFQAARNLEQGLFKSRWCGEYFNFFNCRGGKMLFGCDCSFFSQKEQRLVRGFLLLFWSFLLQGESSAEYIFIWSMRLFWSEQQIK